MAQIIDPQLRGIIRCTRYAFMPNRLHFCGPENQADILEFYSGMNENKIAKRSIKPLLEKFETMYPYLKVIARANEVKNPLDEQVVEAYWLGNENLEEVSLSALYFHLTDTLGVKKKLGMKNFINFEKGFSKKSLPHHNFHVFSVWRRTGKTEDFHTLATIDACRISWGLVTHVGSGYLRLKTRPLSSSARGEIFEGEIVEKNVLNQAENSPLLKNVTEGDLVSLHWGAPCEKLTERQVANLQKYTELCISIANSDLNRNF